MLNKHDTKTLTTIKELTLELELLRQTNTIIGRYTRKKITTLLVELTFDGIPQELKTARTLLERHYNYYMVGNKRPIWRDNAPTKDGSYGF